MGICPFDDGKKTKTNHLLFGTRGVLLHKNSRAPALWSPETKERALQKSF